MLSKSATGRNRKPLLKSALIIPPTPSSGLFQIATIKIASKPETAAD